MRELNGRAAEPDHSIQDWKLYNTWSTQPKETLVGIGSVPPPTMHESESTANLSEQHDKQKKQSCNHPVVAYAKQTTQHQNQQTNLQNTLESTPNTLQFAQQATPPSPSPKFFLNNKSLLILERKCTNWDQNIKHTMKGTLRRRQWAIA